MFGGSEFTMNAINGVIAGAESGVEPEPLTEDDIERMKYIAKHKEEEARRRKASGIERKQAIERLNKKDKPIQSQSDSRMMLLKFFLVILVISIIAIFLLRDKLFYDL